MSRRLLSLLVLGTSLHWAMSILAQISAPSPNDAIRVTVSLNADGSRTVYQFDNAKHKAIATTSDSDGKSRGKIVYQIGEAGRFASGGVFLPNAKILFNS